MKKFDEILDDTTLNIGSGNISVPCTITFRSDTVGRKIELSTNSIDYFEPSIDVTNAAFLIVVVTTPFTDIKVTGDIGDVLTVVS